MTCPRFVPSPCRAPCHSTLPLVSTLPDEDWLPIVWCPADFSLEFFQCAVEQLIHHPEYNSTLILRSETIHETSYTHHDSPQGDLESHRPICTVHRKLLPRRPARDTALEQHCTLYASETDTITSTLVLTPLIPPGTSLPYYHPPVRKLAFRFVPCTPPILRIEAVVLPHVDVPIDLNGRLYRTALALLEALHRYGWGAVTQYQKRVKHDCLVPREAYQDLYLVLRERHRHWVETWHESTDPLKHVYEDIGIATYLMLLWKQTFADGDGDGRWPQPPGGFLDLGCGNGFLTHILVSEGYHGHGVDLRARVSWGHYPAETRAALHVQAVDPTRGRAGMVMPSRGPGVFLIGNHADELTPWVPVMATLERASGYLSIPCCAWSFDARFERASAARWVGAVEDEDAFLARLNLEADGGHQSRYAVYRIWLARLSAWLGWEIECDTLRIPSTRNWAIVGRQRPGDDPVHVQRAHDIVREVVKRGTFKTRTPEGKAGDH